MAEAEARHVQHEITVDAPAQAVYRLIADVENWPLMFPPSVHVECLERHGSQERIRIWATANDDAKTWTSRRTQDPDGLRVDFRQEVSQDPVAQMGGAWVIEPVTGQRCRVRLLHGYRALGDDPGKLAWIDQAVDRNSHAELAALKRTAEMAAGDPGLLLTFEDSLHVNGPQKAVFEFLADGHLWQKRLPHVVSSELRESSPGLQILHMGTRSKHGSVHVTRSVRVCFPYNRIVYKQIEVPPLMTLHTGQWRLTEIYGGTTVTSRHTVVINKAKISEVLGADAGVAQARNYIRDALGTNSLATMGHARDYAVADRPR